VESPKVLNSKHFGTDITLGLSYPEGIERKGIKPMSATATATTTAIRNYIAIAATIAIASMSLTDIFENPARIAQQGRIDGYAQYASVGLVAAAQTRLR
jgi:hypothetical protein